jgi:hypothetical protein
LSLCLAHGTSFPALYTTNSQPEQAPGITKLRRQAFAELADGLQAGHLVGGKCLVYHGLAFNLNP